MSNALYSAVDAASLPAVQAALPGASSSERGHALVAAAQGASDAIFDLLMAKEHEDFAIDGALKSAVECRYFHGLNSLLPLARDFPIARALSAAIAKLQDDVALCIISYLRPGFDGGEELEFAVANAGPEVVRSLIPFAGPMSRATSLFAAAIMQRADVVDMLVPDVEYVDDVISRLLASRHWVTDTGAPPSHLAGADLLLAFVPRAQALGFMEQVPALRAQPRATALLQQIELEKVIAPGEGRSAPRM